VKLKENFEFPGKDILSMAYLHIETVMSRQKYSMDSKQGYTV